MNQPLIIRAEAEQDAKDAQDYYDYRQAGLGDRFLARLSEALSRVQNMPKAYGLVGKNIRVKRLSKFPYVVYYRTLPAQIEVIAILHAHRDPSVWKDRV